MPCKSLAFLGSLVYLFPSVHECTEKRADEAAQLVYVPDFFLSRPIMIDENGHNFA